MTRNKNTASDRDKLTAEYRHYKGIYHANHDTVFVRLIDHLRERVSNNLHIGDAEAATFLRGHDFTDTAGAGFKVNNNGLPIYMREVCAECPDLARRIELRASRFDVFYL